MLPSSPTFSLTCHKPSNKLALDPVTTLTSGARMWGRTRGKQSVSLRRHYKLTSWCDSLYTCSLNLCLNFNLARKANGVIMGVTEMVFIREQTSPLSLWRMCIPKIRFSKIMLYYDLESFTNRENSIELSQNSNTNSIWCQTRPEITTTTTTLPKPRLYFSPTQS